MQASGIDRRDPGCAAGAPAGGADSPGRVDAAPPKGVPAGAELQHADGHVPRFRALLRTKKSAPEAAGAAPGSGAGAAPELSRPVPQLASPAREISVRAVAPRAEVARLLVGQARAAPEARVELRGGVFAGTSIHLVAGVGGVEVRLGAPTEAARLALASVIDRVGLHLRSRGIVMRPGAPADTGSRRQRDDRERKG